MKVYIEKKSHPYTHDRYLVHWNDPETGYVFCDWFKTLKEINEYFSQFPVLEFIRVNF